MPDRYIRPNWFTTNVFNRLVAVLTSLGLSVYGSRVLAVRGRSSGEWRTTPVNLMFYKNERYLLSPRGVTQWVRNLRSRGSGELRVGWRREAIQVVELTNEEKPEVLRAYLRKWKFEVGVFFQGVGPDSPESEIAQIAPQYPVFRLIS